MSDRKPCDPKCGSCPGECELSRVHPTDKRIDELERLLGLLLPSKGARKGN